MCVHVKKHTLSLVQINGKINWEHSKAPTPQFVFLRTNTNNWCPHQVHQFEDSFFNHVVKKNNNTD